MMRMSSVCFLLCQELPRSVALRSACMHAGVDITGLPANGAVSLKLEAVKKMVQRKADTPPPNDRQPSPVRLPWKSMLFSCAATPESHVYSDLIGTSCWSLCMSGACPSASLCVYKVQVDFSVGFSIPSRPTKYIEQ